MRMRIGWLVIGGVLGLGQSAAQTARLDPTTFVVMGEGLAAGMANFGLSSTVQSGSFPALIATQMKTGFPQPLMQPPGIGDVIGYPAREASYPVYPQGTVRVFPPQPNPNDNAPPLFVFNLSVPGFTLADAVNMRPLAPIVQRNMKQTVVNLILGFPQLFFQRPVPLWTQLEYARAMSPTVALVELGYYEALTAAVAGDAARMPDPAVFGATYASLVKGLREVQAQVIVTTVPNPLDTAYFSSPEAAALLLATTPFTLTGGYGLGPGDSITRNGLQTIAAQFWNRTLGPLPADSILKAAQAAEITSRVNALNAQIVNAARANGAVIYDLNAFVRRMRVAGAVAGNSAVSADYLGGFYSLDGVYPGITGHALIANDILAFLNQTYRTAFAAVDVPSVAARDPALSYRKPAPVAGALNEVLR